MFDRVKEISNRWDSLPVGPWRVDEAHPKDEGKYHHINDFIGKTVGAVSGMAAERDIDRRAPSGVIVRRAQSFDQLYAEFDAGELDAIADGFIESLVRLGVGSGA